MPERTEYGNGAGQDHVCWNSIWYAPTLQRFMS